MDLLEKTQELLNAHPLCDHCIGRQFALLGYGLSDQKRGESLKLLLTMKNHQLALDGNKEGFSNLRILAANGSFEMAAKILRNMRKRPRKKGECHLCQGLFKSVDVLVENALDELKAYEYTTFLVGIELPTAVEEREDEFKAEFDVKHGEGMRNGFSRGIGKKISEMTQKTADYKTPDIVVIVKPFTEKITLQANPLYIAGRYKKLTRGIPSLSASFAIIGVTILTAVEIFTVSVIPTLTNLHESYDEMIDRNLLEIQTNINITSVSTALNGSNYDHTISIKNKGSTTLIIEDFNILINGIIQNFNGNDNYLFPENETQLHVNNLSGSGSQRLKVISGNGISDYIEYTI